MAKVITTELQHSGASAANITLDSSKNVTCENNLQVDGNVTVTGTLPADKLTGTAAAINGSNITNLPAANLTGTLPAISGANLTGISTPLSFRNLIDNGGMRIAQRGTSKTGVTSTGRYCLDRWQTEVAHDTGYGTYTISQESSATLPDGHTNSYKIQCTTADTSVGSNDMVTIYTAIEARDCVRLRYGTADALTTTLSFWVRTNLENKTGFVMLYKNDNVERHICKSYTTHGTAGTWKKVTLTFPGDTTGAINNDEGAGVYLQWFLCAGATQSVDPPTSWANYNSNAKAKGTTIEIASSTDNYYEITGVQWEVGTTATDYEHKSWHDELHKCQRYYWRVSGNANDMPGWNHIMWHASASFAHFTCPVPMRSQPSFTQNCTAKIVSSDNSDTWTSGMYIDNAVTNHDNGGGFHSGTFRKDIAGSSIDKPGTTQITVAGNFEFAAEI